LAQGAYYLLTGVWPLVSIGSFQRVTGPKTDLWLVKTVGLLISVIGGVLGLAGWQRRDSLDSRLLGAGSAAGLASIWSMWRGVASHRSICWMRWPRRS
jgi:hypothetical protein